MPQKTLQLQFPYNQVDRGSSLARLEGEHSGDSLCQLCPRSNPVDEFPNDGGRLVEPMGATARWVVEEFLAFRLANQKVGPANDRPDL